MFICGHRLCKNILFQCVFLGYFCLFLVHFSGGNGFDCIKLYIIYNEMRNYVRTLCDEVKKVRNAHILYFPVVVEMITLPK